MRDTWPNSPVIPIARAVFGNFSHINGIIHAHGPNAMALASVEQNEVLPISEHGFMFYQRWIRAL
jgi:ribulose-5-phosphate 4-epimerase/fuculose-1-phosphate aldolase